MSGSSYSINNSIGYLGRLIEKLNRNTCNLVDLLGSKPLQPILYCDENCNITGGVAYTILENDDADVITEYYFDELFNISNSLPLGSPCENRCPADLIQIPIFGACYDTLSGTVLVDGTIIKHPDDSREYIFIVAKSTDPNYTVGDEITDVTNFVRIDSKVCNSNSFSSVTIDSTDSIPNNFEVCQDAVYVNLTLTSDLDMTSYTPVGLCEGALLRIRLADTNGSKLVWQTYGFVNNVGDVLTLKWDGSQLNIV